ncbi:MAG: TetR/AcrR family transcriptional regulator [Streptosporangiaceae bacterium]
MPRLWNETIEEHRQAVHGAALDAFAALIGEHGLASVTMSQLAAAAGIGRATLYKYFPDIESVLLAWHERQVARHLTLLAQARDTAGSPAARLEAVLSAYAQIQHQHHGTDLPVALLHRGEHVTAATRQLHALVSGLITACTEAGDIPAGIPAGELASYCLHALGAAGTLPSPAAARRLVAVTLAGLQAPPD